MRFLPATSERWADLEALFGPCGAYSGCWCMWWRLTRAEFGRRSAEERKGGLKALADSEQPPGLLAYIGDEPVAWCCVGPREGFPSLERSRTLRRVDDQPVWSIVCFYIARGHRGQGHLLELIQGAVAYAVKNGATIVEAYPVDVPQGERLQAGSGYMGLMTVFRAAGFEEVARRSVRQPIVRLTVL